MNSKKTLANLMASLFAYIFSVGINFILSPYITKTLGVEANGFVVLANQCVGYLSLLTVTLNSMAGRFVSIHLMNDEVNKAKIYFSSVFIANFIISLTLILPLLIFSLNIDIIFDISSGLVHDAIILFILVSLNFFISITTNIFSVSTFIVNRLYLASYRATQANLIRCVLLFTMYTFLPSKMYYVTLSAIVYTIYIFSWNLHYTKKYTPELIVKQSLFKLSACFELIKSGAWNLLISLNSILNTGLDLLLCNLFIDATSMGILAISKILPTAISSLVNTISGTFGPPMSKYYAKDDNKSLSDCIMSSIAILGFFINIPIIIFITLGNSFYNLWQPLISHSELYWLSLLAVFGAMVSGSHACVFGLFTIINKLKFHSISTLIFGIINTLIVTIALSLTNAHGVYIIAGTSTALIILRNLFFTFPYAARCIQQKWYIFHLASLRSTLGVLITSGLGYCIVRDVNITNWYSFLYYSIIISILSVVVNVLLLFNQNERKKYAKILLYKLLKK